MSAGPSAETAVWLNDLVVLADCRLASDVAAVSVHAELDGLRRDAECLLHRYRHPQDEPGGDRTLVIARFRPEDSVRHRGGGLTLRAGDAVAPVGPALGRTAGIEPFVTEHLATLDRPTRLAVLSFIVDSCLPALEEVDGARLSESLHVVSEGLRARLPAANHAAPGLTISADLLMAIDDRSFWIEGWIRDLEDEATAVVAISPEGQRVELLATAYRQLRRDIQEGYASHGLDRTRRHGYVNYFQLPAPSRLQEGWTVQLLTAAGGGVETQAPAVRRGYADIRERILNRPLVDRPGTYELTSRFVHPALSRMQDRLRRLVAIEEVIEFGEPPPSPATTVIVPLYQRLDFLEHQLLQFSLDPELHAADLIFVLDSPELERSLLTKAARLNEHYGVPFRVALMNRSGGFAIANNLAAGLARGRTLLLLNSDAFPVRPGWLGAMKGFYDATPGIGALGPKLLFEDDSIQHAGMFFEYDVPTRVWRNDHYYKGMVRDFPPANVARPVPAVTGACMMVDRELYERLGGLRDIYVQGGYEDSDFCIRLVEVGCRNWYLPHVELYHLEDQSFPSELRTLMASYNGWLHTHLWRDRIEDIMSAQAREDAEAALAFAS
jgi:GT2 family glycosyltransferase